MAVSSEEQKRLQEAAASAANENSPAAGTPPFTDPKQLVSVDPRAGSFAPAAGMPPPGASIANMGAETFSRLYNNPPDQGPLVPPTASLDESRKVGRMEQVADPADDGRTLGGFLKAVFKGEPIYDTSVSRAAGATGPSLPKAGDSIQQTTSAPEDTFFGALAAGSNAQEKRFVDAYNAGGVFGGVIPQVGREIGAGYQGLWDSVKSPLAGVAAGVTQVAAGPKAGAAVREAIAPVAPKVPPSTPPGAGMPSLQGTKDWQTANLAKTMGLSGAGADAATKLLGEAGMVTPKADATGAPPVSTTERMATQAEMKAGSAPTIKQFETPYGSAEFGLGAPKKEIKQGEWNTPSSTPDWIAKANEYARNNPMTAERVQRALSVKDPSPEELQAAQARAAENAQAVREMRDRRDRAEALGSVRVTDPTQRETELRNARVGLDTNTPHGAFMANKATKALQAQYGAEDAAKANMAAELYKADRLQQTGQQKADTQYQLGMLRHDAAQMNADTRKEVAQMRADQDKMIPVYDEVVGEDGVKRKVFNGSFSTKEGIVKPANKAQQAKIPIPPTLKNSHPNLALIWEGLQPEAQDAALRRLKNGTLDDKDFAAK